MTEARIALQEELLNKVNGGVYFDEANMLIGDSEDGPLYKFVSYDAMVSSANIILAEAMADFLYPAIPDVLRSESGEKLAMIDVLLQSGYIVPYNP